MVITLPDDGALAAARQLLAPDHRLYVTTVSTPGMALSLETSALLWCLCCSLRPASVADLGSGFSSYVVRRFQRDVLPACRVVSSDDDPLWLPRSRAFCRDRGLSDGGFVPWPDLKQAAGRYDLVVYDLGRMQVRDSELPSALQMLSPAGVVIIDDMHKFNYGLRVRRELQALGLAGVDLRAQTTDAHEGRHAWLAYRPA